MAQDSEAGQAGLGSPDLNLLIGEDQISPGQSFELSESAPGQDSHNHPALLLWRQVTQQPAKLGRIARTNYRSQSSKITVESNRKGA